MLVLVDVNILILAVQNGALKKLANTACMIRLGSYV
jgi:hypothetical protein